MGTQRAPRHVRLTLGVCLLTALFTTEADPSVECPPITGFAGQLVSLSDGLREGSKAQFLCPTGQYPWPISSRTCQPNGQWSAIRSSTGRKHNAVVCKSMRCPEPISFDNGEFYPRGPYVVGANITFRCNDGYQMRGSEERTCQRNARWSGEMAVCDNGAGHCPDPGVPPGAVKTGDRYDVDERVSYECSRGLTLMGSKSRMCLENRRWSGTEASCQYPYSFDLPEDVGQRFIGSISGVLNTKQSSAVSKSAGRTVNIKKDGVMNVYILLDASRSVGEESFEIYKECAKHIVDGLGRFDMKIEFGVLSFATEPKEVVKIYDVDSDDSDTVLGLIEEDLKYSDHKDKSGTNTKGALEAVLNMMAFQKIRYDGNAWDSIQHVIILMTDGKSNMGGQPKETMRRIMDFLNINENRNEFLDVYAFGVGTENVDKTELNEIASKKNDEKHVFILESVEDMKNVFKEILVIKKYGDMCGLNEDLPDPDDPKKWSYPFPWTAIINTATSVPCMGSLISQSWVLTAAHCFRNKLAQRVKIGKDDYDVKDIKIHDCYNLSRKQPIGLKEDYDYDVALIQLKTPVVFSPSARPICIPCTEPANRAMKKRPTSTCKDHRDWLLKSNEVAAGYLARKGKNVIHPSLKTNEVLVKINQARDACVAAVRTWEAFKDIDPLLLVSPRHLCVEGDMSCKGESGGPLFTDVKRRFFQLGVLSFGLFDPCFDTTKRKLPPRGFEARDFHVSVLEVLPWIRKHVAEDLEFLPDIENQEDIRCPT
ncbi:complement C2-like [Spea bombifrons]|uniref:complement C2-like n=1 Tax=Spea bombifrons TaxID=233779 RepID=UPI00234907D2|nr:complement C2-like [Spea bombifrons]